MNRVDGIGGWARRMRREYEMERGQGRRCDVTAASGLRLTTVPLCFFTLPRSSVRYLDYLVERFVNADGDSRRGDILQFLEIGGFESIIRFSR